MLLIKWFTWKRLAVFLFGVFVFFAGVTCVVVVNQNQQIYNSAKTLEDLARDNKTINTKTKRSVEILESVTSPEAQAQQQAVLAQAIQQLDCNNQRTVQRGVDALSPANQRVMIMTPACIQYFLEHPGA